MKKKIVVTVAVFLLISLVPMPAFATSYTVSDGETFNISTISDGDIITVDAGATATITGSKNVAIICGSSVHLTIENLIIDVRATTDLNALAFTGTDNTLTLVGASSFKSGEYQSGINVGGTTSLTINGTGSLSATGGYNGGAGIGGNVSESGGTITIVGGDITASGGVCGGAGIGGSRNGYGGITTISGGNVTAYGGPDSAGIGGGYGRNGGTISIENGTVVSTGGDGGAGIGGGINANGGNIYIYGGNVTASDTNGAGIGGGSNASSGNITISGGTINASSVSGAGIGGGNSGNGDFIIIEGGTINTSSNMGAGIGGGKLSDGGYITISGGTISASSGDGGAGIGGGSQGDGGVITITGGTITAKNTENGAGIGGGAFASGGTIKISGGMVYAARGTNAPYDIGDGKLEVSGTLQISGTAIVFSKNNYCIPPSLGSGNVHKADDDAQFPLNFSSNSVYGITVDPSWTDAKGGYFALKILEYNINGGSGTTPDSVAIALGKSTTLSSSTGFSKNGYDFAGWNTAANGNGTNYPDGSLYAPSNDVPLYAKWTLPPTPTPTPTAVPTVTPSPTTAPTAKPRRTSSTTNTPAPTPSPPPQPSVTQTPAPSGEATATPAPAISETPIPTPTQTPPAAITTDVVSTDDGKTVVNIDVTSLPQGTSAVKLPSGQIVPIDTAENGMLTIEIFDGWNNEDGSITLVMLNDDEVALGSYNIESPSGKASSNIPIWIIIILVGVMAVVWGVVVYSRKVA